MVCGKPFVLDDPLHLLIGWGTEHGLYCTVNLQDVRKLLHEKYADWPFLHPHLTYDLVRDRIRTARGRQDLLDMLWGEATPVVPATNIDIDNMRMPWE